MHRIQNKHLQAMRRRQIDALQSIAALERDIEQLQSDSLAKKFDVAVRFVQPEHVKRVMKRGESYRGRIFSYEDAKLVYECIKERKRLQYELKKLKVRAGL